MPQLQGRVPDEDLLGLRQRSSSMPSLIGSMTSQPCIGIQLVSSCIAEVACWLVAWSCHIYILTKTGKIIVRKSVWGLSDNVVANPDIKIRLVKFDKGIRSKIGDDLVEAINPELSGSMLEVSDDVFDDEDEGHMDAGDTSSPDEGTNNHHTCESYSEYMTAQTHLSQGGEAKKATVVGTRKR